VSRDRERLLEEIRQAEAQIAALDAERAAVQQRLKALRRQTDASHAPPSAGPEAGSSPSTTKDKLALFRALFRGRADVFPKRWHNRKTGRKGYSPACSNEWVAGLCKKPKVRCGDCPHQAFLPVTDRVILDHLRGQHVIGVYPMLEDETCWFLAMDFDKGDWQRDITAVVQTCEQLDVPVAVERSRSGAGGHLWFFFAAPLPAALARKKGCYLLTRTMELHHELSMSSYDRLFPNQDTLPRGGFGNLIALPFQDGPRRQGNSVFVDKRWDALEDQWGYLAGCRRMSTAQVEDLARQAIRTDQVLGVRRGGKVDEGDNQEVLAPWFPSPSRHVRKKVVTGPLPPAVRAVLAQRLFLERGVLPPALLNQIRRLAAFQNPEFYKRQALRLSTARTPMVISCAEDLNEHIALPRGCLAELEALLRDHGVDLEVEDKRTEGQPLELGFHGQLRPSQEQAVRAVLASDIGVFVAPPGAGKTVVGAYLAACRGRSTLVLVHRTQLLDQWRTQLAVFLDLKPQAIGQIGGGRRRATGELDVAMIQSLTRKGEVDELVAGYGHVIVDECHHVPAVSFERVMREVHARYVTGLTATPRRRDGHHPILEFELGPVRFTLDAKVQADARPFLHRLVVRETGFGLTGEVDSDPSIQTIYQQLTRHEARNRQILDDVLQALEEGRSPIVLTERRDHLAFLTEKLEPFARNLVVLRGGMSARQRRAVKEQLAAIPDDEERLMLATGRFIGEGFDDARLDTLMLAMPVSWRGTLVQYAGRLHRMHRRKQEVRIYDYADRQVPMLEKMYQKRLRGYGAMGYRTAGKGETISSVGVTEEPVVEYDEDALRMLEGDED
jgi:superfamily II DNA or RNA helicase